MLKFFYLIALSIIGFAVSFYLYYSKTSNKKIICIVGEDCDGVVKSKYGKTFGIENTIPGMLYFVMIFVYSIVILTNPNIFKESLIYYFVVGISIITVLFSAYLTSVQAFVLKKWCEYCILSSITSVLILSILIQLAY